MEENRTPNLPETPASYFDGTTLQLICWRLLGWLLGIVTLGIGAAWAHCMVLRWEINHTVVNGQRLRFDGKGHQLLGRWLLWGLLTLITLGIYAIFIPVRMEKWCASHTRFAAAGETNDSISGVAVLGGILGGILVLGLLIGGIFGLYAYREELPKVELPERPVPQKPVPEVPDGGVIFVPIETLPPETEAPAFEPTTADGVWLPSPNDDEDFWYVNNPKDGLNMRYGPGTEYDVVRNLPHGTEIEVLDWQDGWAFTGEGWCAGNYLEINPPKDAQSSKKDIVGHWAFIREATKRQTWSGDGYYVAMLRFYSDGTFRSETAMVSYDEIGGTLSWVPEGMVDGSENSGTYTYQDGILRMEYADGHSVKTSAKWDGKQMKLSDPEGIRVLGEGGDESRLAKAHPVLLPLKEEVDIYFDLPALVSAYID